MQSRQPTTLQSQPDSTVKVINGQQLSQPNLKVFRKQQVVFSKKAKESACPLAEFNETQNRFLMSLPPGQGMKSLISQRGSESIKADSMAEELQQHKQNMQESQANKQKSMTEALQSIQSATFTPGTWQEQEEPEVSCLADYRKQFQAKKQELEGFRIP